MNAQALKDSCAWLLANGGSGGNQLKVNGLPNAERIEVVDEVTVRLHLDRPVAWGLYGNALLGTSIVHAKEIMQHATADDPYGIKWLETRTVESGPFVIENRQKGTMMSFVPNPYALQPPQLERIILFSEFENVVTRAPISSTVCSRGIWRHCCRVLPVSCSRSSRWPLSRGLPWPA